MEFDERLQRTFESLTARLQQEIAGQLSAAGAELSASALADRDAALASPRRRGCRGGPRDSNGDRA